MDVVVFETTLGVPFIRLPLFRLILTPLSLRLLCVCSTRELSLSPAEDSIEIAAFKTRSSMATVGPVSSYGAVGSKCSAA